MRQWRRGAWASRFCAASVALAALSGPGVLHVSLRPAVVRLGEFGTVRVEGWQASRLEVALQGASGPDGRLLGWRAARGRGRTLEAVLPRPALRGIYPLLLRERAGAPVV